MRLGSTFTLLSDTLFKSLFKFLFRYDVFISYARGDGKEYALKLRDQLKQLDFSCFLDFDELPPGNALNNTLKRAIKKSAALVIVGTERAVKSRYVELEVGEFSKTGRAIIPIDIEGTLADTPWEIIKERDIVWIDEVKTALTKGVPSPTVADSIDKLFKYTRRNTRVRAQVLSTLILFVVVVAASLFLIRQQVKAATRASVRAELASAESKERQTAADKAKIAADKAIDAARIAEGNLKTSRIETATAQKKAENAANDAKKQEGIALANAERAKAEQARAEERTRYVQAQQMGAQAGIARDTGDDLDRSVLLSIESLKGAMTPEGYIAWERAMDLLPHPVEDSSGATKMWDRKTYKLPEGMNTYGAQSIAFSPDGRYAALAGSSTGSFLRVIDLVNPALIMEKQLEQVNHVMSVDFSPKGKWLALGCHVNGGQSQIMFWDVASFDKTDKGTPKTVGSITKEGLRGTLKQISFSPMGNYLAVADISGSIAIWSIADDNEPITATEINQSQQIKGKPGMGGTILAFSPDENYIAAAPDQHTVGVWEVRTGREVSRIEHQNDIKTIAFSPDGRLLATIGEGVVLWKIEFGSEARRLPINGTSSEVELKALTISPGEGEWLAIGSSDGARVFRTADWRQIAALAHGEDIGRVIFSRDGRWLITASKNKVTAFETRGWKEAKVVVVVDPSEGLKERAATLDIANGPDVTFSPEGGTLVVVIGSQLKLFEVGSWREGPTMKHSDRVRKVSFSPDGRWVAVETADEYRSGSGHVNLRRERAYVWATSTGLPVACRTDRDDYSQSERSSLERVDNRRAVCPEIKTNQQQLALLAEVPKWKQVLKTDVLDSTSQDGLWSVEVEYGRNITLSLKDGKTSRRVAGFTPDGAVKGLAFSPDSRWLVVGSDKAVMLWPLKASDMIDEACARLRRRDLTPDEWKQYFSGEKLQPTCSQRRP